MLQRIQSIYLLGVCVLMSLAVYLPLISFVDSGGSYVGLEALGFWSREGYSYTLGIISMGAISALIALITIFLFKNRKKQLMLCKMNIFFIVFFYVTIAAYVYFAQDDYGLVFETIRCGLVLPIIALIFNVLALLRINADEKLVRSTERIR